MSKRRPKPQLLTPEEAERATGRKRAELLAQVPHQMTPQGIAYRAEHLVLFCKVSKERK